MPELRKAEATQQLLLLGGMLQRASSERSGEAMSDLVKCPDCDHGFILVVVASATTGTSLMSCNRCRGSGRIEGKHLRWIEIGKQCRTIRICEDLGIRSGSIEYGMKPSELLALENGQVDPTEHAKRLGIEVDE